MSGNGTPAEEREDCRGCHLHFTAPWDGTMTHYCSETIITARPVSPVLPLDGPVEPDALCPLRNKGKRA